MLSLSQWFLFAILVLPVQQEPPAPAVRFEIKNAGITVDGYFENSTYTIQFDPKKLNSSTLEGTARVASLRTGITLRDRHLQGRQYFRADTYPEISMKSKSIRSQGNNTYLGVFEIKIKDSVKEMSIPFQVESRGPLTHYKARFVLNRLDFGLGEKSLVLADDVTVILDIMKNPK